jgi:hypothetical protein
MLWRAASGSRAISTPATWAVASGIDSSVAGIFQGRRLPRAVGPEEAERLAALDPQIDPARTASRSPSA